jgi:hypothetical protein
LWCGCCCCCWLAGALPSVPRSTIATSSMVYHVCCGAPGFSFK